MKGIIFDAESVRAILVGAKTQTRRALPEQPVAGFERYGQVSPNGTQWFVDNLIDPDHPTTSTFHIQARYQPDETVYVKEAFVLGRAPNDEPGQGIAVVPDMAAAGGTTIYHPDMPENRYTWCREWKPQSPLFMPKWASRIRLVITGVRVERLQDISEADAEAEGVFAHIAEYSRDKIFRSARGETAIAYFQERWDAINAKRAPWETNPWVWVYEFRRVK